jgi:hypothetical protein
MVKLSEGGDSTQRFVLGGQELPVVLARQLESVRLPWCMGQWRIKGRSRGSSGGGCSTCGGSSSADSFVSVDDDRDNELKLTREAAQLAAVHP